MPGKRRSGNAAASWALVAMLGAAAALRPACIEPGASTPFDAAPMLAALPEAVILPSLRSAAGATADLEVAAEAWRSARTSGDGSAELLAAQDAWRAAMDAWQRAEVLQIGPAGSSGSARGGLDLRDEVYSWPTVNPCRVDQELVEGDFGSAAFFDDNLVNVYGLDALEYLLFHPGPNACAGQHPINEDGTWDGLGADGLLDARAGYAAAVAARVAADVQEIVDAWEPTGGDFAGELARAGANGDVYPTELSAVNAVFDALFYLELETKDAKLGVPLGIQEGCGAPPCPESLESPWAGGARRNIAANLAGFRALYLGGEGLGFDDLLISLDEGALDASVQAALDAAEAQAALPGELAAQLVDDSAQVEALYDAIKAVSDLLKNDLAAVLVLQIPNEAGGDND
jgi:predicted lipoprotein